MICLKWYLGSTKRSSLLKLWSTQKSKCVKSSFTDVHYNNHFQAVKKLEMGPSDADIRRREAVEMFVSVLK